MSTKVPLYNERGYRKPHTASTAKVAGLTGALAQDLERGRTDPVWWALRFLGVKLHRDQQRWVRYAARRAADGYSPALLTTLVSAGNRAGKTLGLAIIVAHHCFYKLGLRPPKPNDRADAQRFATLPYFWYHLAPQQTIAEIVFNELVRIFSGSHPAQFDKETGEARGCPLMDELGAVVMWDRKYRGEYLWIRFHPVVGGAEIHFRTTDDKAKAMLGLDAHGISLDEAAFELYLDTVRNEVLNTRRMSTGGPLHAISTPSEGVNAFSDWWEEGNPANPYRHPKVLALRMSTRANVGFGITQSNLDDMIAQMPEYLVPQNIDGEFIEAVDAYFHAPAVEAVFDLDQAEELKPERGHRYVNGVDPGIASDATGSLVLDYTVRPIKGVRLSKRQGRQAIPAVVNMVRENHLLYQQDGASCTTILDSTGMGGKMFRQEFSIIRPLREYDFAGTKAKKLELLSDLKAVIDRGDIRLPKRGLWAQLRRQILGYKLDDKKLDTDLVMALALAVRHAVRNSGGMEANPTFKYYG